MVKVKRWHFDLSGADQSCEVSYYISNGDFDKNEDYLSAILEHWSVETNNHIRDVSLKEDQLRTKEKSVTRVLYVFKTLVIKLLKKTNTNNMLVQIQLF